MENKPLNLSSLKGKIIAIDGPAGSGKSTTSKLIAAKLGYTYLDTGAMYRALTYYAILKKIPFSDGEELTKIAQALPINFKTSSDTNRVFLKDTEITDEIRLPEVTKNASEVAAHKGVREAMVVKQQKFGKNGSIVAEGRDTTTVVFPHADIKIYLNATVKQRAQRRLLDLMKMGVTVSLQELEEDINSRDHKDSSREHSPLTKAKDAILVDTSNMTLEGQVDYILNIIRTTFKSR